MNDRPLVEVRKKRLTVRRSWRDKICCDGERLLVVRGEGSTANARKLTAVGKAPRAGNIEALGGTWTVSELERIGELGEAPVGGKMQAVSTVKATVRWTAALQKIHVSLWLDT